ncbi:MAG: thioredoxin [Acidimicrobiia bacterium]
MTTHVIDIGEAEFSTQVLEASKTAPVVVDFWASWCQPCKTLSPILERAAVDGGGSFTLAKVDVDANQRLAQAFSIQSIPTVIAFRDGQPVDMFTGALGEAQVRAFISRLVPPATDERVAAAEGLIEAGNVAGAEASLRALLEEDPVNSEAALTLVGLLIDDGRTNEAIEILERQSQTNEVKQMMAAARLIGSGEVDLSDPEEALPRLLAAVEAGGEGREPARLTMIDVFDLLGPEHELTLEYRRRLASALF